MPACQGCLAARTTTGASGSPRHTAHWKSSATTPSFNSMASKGSAVSLLVTALGAKLAAAIAPLQSVCAGQLLGDVATLGREASPPWNASLITHHFASRSQCAKGCCTRVVTSLGRCCSLRCCRTRPDEYKRSCQERDQTAVSISEAGCITTYTNERLIQRSTPVTLKVFGTI